MSSNPIDLVRNGRRRFAWRLLPLLALLVGVIVVVPQRATSSPQITQLVSSHTAADGTVFTATNHLVGDARATGKFLVVWAGDQNASDHNSSSLQDATRPAVNPVRIQHEGVPDASPGNDFLAVIDADPA